MTLIMIDTTELVEMRTDLNDLIRQADAVNTESDGRIAKFHALELDEDMKTRILDILFRDIKDEEQ